MKLQLAINEAQNQLADVEQVRLRCQASKLLEEGGDYHGAIEALSPWWAGPGSSVNVNGLDGATVALLLLRAGSLVGWLGGSSGSQEAAKDMLTQSADLSYTLGLTELAAEAYRSIGICSWREGAWEDARVWLERSLAEARVESELGFLVRLDLAYVERATGKVPRALEIYDDLAPVVDTLSDRLRGLFHNGLGAALLEARNLDEALIELTAASFYFDRAGHALFAAAVESNISIALLRAGQPADSRNHLRRARETFERLGDDVRLAQALETEARAYLAEGLPIEGEKEALRSLALLIGRDEHALTVESLLTLAQSLVVQSRHTDALKRYAEAYETASTYISDMRAAQVAREMIENLAGYAFVDSGAPFDGSVLGFERQLIRRALDLSGGRVTEASIRLGMKHQTLAWMLQTRHAAERRLPSRKRRFKNLIDHKTDRKPDH
jgi:tetratricopeptide (TPR) repeat protein